MKMTPEEEYELITAYFDGEIAPEERERAEQLLAEDAAAAKLLDEFGALSGDLKNLPKQTLNENLAPAILDRIEREITAGDNMTGSGVSTSIPNDEEYAARHGLAGAAAAVSVADDSDDDRKGLRHGLAFSVLAIAAAILIMIFVPQIRQPDSVVIRDKETDAGKPDAAAIEEESTSYAFDAADASNSAMNAPAAQADKLATLDGQAAKETAATGTRLSIEAAKNESRSRALASRGEEDFVPNAGVAPARSPAPAQTAAAETAPFAPASQAELESEKLVVPAELQEKLNKQQQNLRSFGAVAAKAESLNQNSGTESLRRLAALGKLIENRPVDGVVFVDASTTVTMNLLAQLDDDPLDRAASKRLNQDVVDAEQFARRKVASTDAAELKSATGRDAKVFAKKLNAQIDANSLVYEVRGTQQQLAALFTGLDKESVSFATAQPSFAADGQVADSRDVAFGGGGGGTLGVSSDANKDHLAKSGQRQGTKEPADKPATQVNQFKKGDDSRKAGRAVRRDRSQAPAPVAEASTAAPASDAPTDQLAKRTTDNSDSKSRESDAEGKNKIQKQPRVAQQPLANGDAFSDHVAAPAIGNNASPRIYRYLLVVSAPSIEAPAAAATVREAAESKADREANE